jgi:hypothetical protein
MVSFQCLDGSVECPMFANNLRGLGDVKRCRMHGGAPGSGVPKKEKNALKHGVFAKEAIEDRKHVQALIGETRKLLRDIE